MPLLIACASALALSPPTLLPFLLSVLSWREGFFFFFPSGFGQPWIIWCLTESCSYLTSQRSLGFLHLKTLLRNLKLISRKHLSITNTLPHCRHIISPCAAGPSTYSGLLLPSCLPRASHLYLWVTAISPSFTGVLVFTS